MSAWDDDITLLCESFGAEHVVSLPHSQGRRVEVTVSLCPSEDHCSDSVSFPVGAHVSSRRVTLCFLLSSEFPIVPFALTVEGTDPSHTERSNIKKKIDELRETFAGCGGVLAYVAEEMRTYLETRWQQHTRDAQQQLQLPLPTRETNDAVTQRRPEPFRLGRRCVYFHHIFDPKKRRCISTWATELQLVGFCKIGYPGFLLFEGSELGCTEYVARLQSLHWKHMAVRGEEILDFGSDEAAYRAACQIHHEGESIWVTCDAAEYAEWCKGSGLEELFKTGMQIYR